MSDEPKVGDMAVDVTGLPMWPIANVHEYDWVMDWWRVSNAEGVKGHVYRSDCDLGWVWLR